MSLSLLCFLAPPTYHVGYIKLGTVVPSYLPSLLSSKKRPQRHDTSLTHHNGYTSWPDFGGWTGGKGRQDACWSTVNSPCASVSFQGIVREWRKEEGMVNNLTALTQTVVFLLLKFLASSIQPSSIRQAWSEKRKRKAKI